MKNEAGSISDQKGPAKALSAVALAIAALLGQSPALADTPAGDLIEKATQQAVAPVSGIKTTSPLPLVLKPSAGTINLGRGHSSHSSHASHSSHSSHSSHYSSTGGAGSGGGRDTPPAKAPSPPRQPPPKPDQPARKAPADAEETTYPFIVHMNDKRMIECDVRTEGDHFLLVKKGGTIRVLKTDVDRIEKNPAYKPPATRPSK